MTQLLVPKSPRLKKNVEGMRLRIGTGTLNETKFESKQEKKTTIIIAQNKTSTSQKFTNLQIVGEQKKRNLEEKNGKGCDEKHHIFVIWPTQGINATQ